MSDEKKSPIHFLGTYFDRDAVLKLARWARILSWAGAGLTLFSWLLSFVQFLIQYSTGMYGFKGQTFLDTLNYFSSYLLQPLGAVTFFFSLQGIAAALLILMDLEENTRRAARSR
ncbi:MAG: hypothetical protein ACOY0R_09995 [Chloroflexota bacterium]